MLMIPIIDAIIKRRVAAGLSQHQLSLQSGIGGSSLSRIERGETSVIHSLRAKAIANTLKCRLSDIFIDY